MNAGFIPFVMLGFGGYIIGIIMLPHVIEYDTYIHNSGVCVVASPVHITTPVIDHNGNPYCKTGQLVKTLPNGS